MAIKVENTFVVPAPPERAFRTLTDAPRIVPCMPGTELTEMLSSDRFRATAKIRVGPVELHFNGEGELIDVDTTKRTSRVRAKGSDSKGRGAFSTDMAFEVQPHGENEARVRVITDLTLSGSVAQYGRGAGIVREITNQLTKQFATNLAALIEAERIVQAAAAHASQMTTIAPKPRAMETVGAAAANRAPSGLETTLSSVRGPSFDHEPTPVMRAAQAATPISGIRLLLGALRTLLRRWFGARP